MTPMNSPFSSTSAESFCLRADYRDVRVAEGALQVRLDAVRSFSSTGVALLGLTANRARP